MIGISPRVLVFVLAGILGGPAAGQEGKDMKLEDVGFIMRPANTPAQLERLKLIPPRKFIARTTTSRRYFIYADPDYCVCAFVGDQLAMKNYQDMVSPPPLAPRAVGSDGASPGSQIIEDMDPGVSGSIYEGDILDYRY